MRRACRGLAAERWLVLVAAAPAGVGAGFPRAGWWRRCDGSAKMESCEQRAVGHPRAAWRAVVLSWWCRPGIFPWRGGFDRRKAVPWGGRRPSQAVLDLAGGAGWLRTLVQAGCGWCCRGLPAGWSVVGPRLCSYIGKCCGSGGVRLLGRDCQSHGGVEMGDARMKILHGFCRAGSDGTRGCHSPPWRHLRACLPHPSRSWCWWMSPGESLDSMFGSARWRRPRRRSSVGSIVFGDMTDSSLLSSGVRRYPFLILGGAMYVCRW
ncbi:hypothetical protein VPH35_082983 [Triticum aestivum]